VIRHFDAWPGTWGWLVVAATVIVTDLYLVAHHEPTMSRTLGHYLGHPVLGPMMAGAWAGLSYHLLVEELITSRER
jgi:hypothetical protein